MNTASQGQVVAAYFDKQADAESAVRDLQTVGFRSDQIGTSYDDFDQEDYGDTDQGSDQKITSDQYSPNSGTASTSAHHESFWDKVKDFFSGETTDSDINDHSTTDRQYAHVSDRSYAGDWNSIPDRYRDRVNDGGGLVTVHASDRIKEAEQILTRNHGQIDRDFSSGSGVNYGSQPGTATGAYNNTSASDTAAGMGQGTRADITGGEVGNQFAGAAQGMRNNAEQAGNRTDREDWNSNAEMRNATPERRIQLISEVLRVRKERVARGEVRLRKEVRTETQNFQVPVTREEIVIDRNPVEGERRATGEIGSDQEIRVPLSEERVQVDKVPVVREEVNVGKRTVSNTQNVSDQVLRDELNVEGDEDAPKQKDPKRKIA